MRTDGCERKQAGVVLAPVSDIFSTSNKQTNKRRSQDREAETHRHAAAGLRLPVGEVADGPGQVVGGHAGRPGEAVGHPAVLVRPAAVHRHVGQRRVLRVVAEAQGEGGLVDGLVEAGEGLPGVDRAELGHCQVPGQGDKTSAPEGPTHPGLQRFCSSSSWTFSTIYRFGCRSGSKWF